MHYNYCPRCGNKLADRPAGDDGPVPYCDQCGKYWFDAFESCVIVMVVNERHEIALLRQGYLSTTYETFVSGYIVPGETAEQTAVREVKEELGLQVERIEYAGTHWFERRGQLMHAFIGHVRKAPFRLSEEVEAASWVDAEAALPRLSPPRPGNTQHHIYWQYMKEIKSGIPT